MKISTRAVHLRLVVGRLIRAIAESHRPIIRKTFFYTFALLAVGIFLAGCGNAITLQPTATRAPSGSPVPPSATPAPSATPSALPSATPTRTPLPTHTARPPTLTSTPTATLIGGSSSKIAYVSCSSSEHTSCEIYVINADGSDAIRFTNNSLRDCCPVWSPDGARIAFVHGLRGITDIYVINVYPVLSSGTGDALQGTDGSNPTNLTKSSNYIDNDPAWSPDGAKIAFYSNRDGASEIYVMNTNGSNPIRLTNNGDNYGPAWSPDGAKIAFFHETYSGRQLWMMNADGSNRAKLTNSSGWDLQIAWSPDSTKIAFVSQGGGTLREISVINVDGSGQTQLTNDKLWHCCPSWSPDGTKIAYIHDMEGTTEIWVMNADGSKPTSITNVDSRSGRPTWSPDGTQLAFEAYGYISVINADGSGRTQLTQTGGWGPAWSPPLPNLPAALSACTSGWTRLVTGGQAKVSADTTTPNRVRAGPSLVSDVITLLHPGTVVEVLEGPICADGLVFWKVESDLIPGGVGWTAEGDGTEYYLVPYQP